MEIKQFLAIFKKYWLFILVFVCLGAAIAYLFTSTLPSGYRQEQLFFISSTQENFEGYNFEGYYGQEKARNFTDTAVAILESQQFQGEVSAQNANISARKITPQLIRITVTADVPEEAEKLIPEIVSNFNRKMLDLIGTNETIQIKTISPPSPAYFVAPEKKIFIPATAAIGAIFGIFIVGLKTYFKL